MGKTRGHMADEEQQNEDIGDAHVQAWREREDKKRRVRDIFLAAAGILYSAFANENEQNNAIAWFNDNFEWREVYDGDEILAANDMTAAYAGIEQSDVDSEAKRQAEFKSERKQPEKRAAEQPKAKQPKKPKQSSGGGSSSDVPLADPASDAMAALVAFMQAFAAMTEAEKRALLEKLQRQ